MVSVIPSDIFALLDERYDEKSPDALLDVYTPAFSARVRLPSVVWMHGSGGNKKSELAAVFRTIAHAGFTVAAINYDFPGANPPPARQAFEALRYLVKFADRYCVDPTRLVLAGDSAGAQLCAQAAAIITNPAYGRRVGVVPAIAPEQIRGVALCSGPEGLATIVGSMSAASHAPELFPPTLITAGRCSFDLEEEDARQAVRGLIAFFEQCTRAEGEQQAIAA